jgi:heme exporter protein D
MSLPSLEAGKYAAYVWPAYGLSGLALVWMLVDSVLRARRWKARAGAQRPDAR